MPMPFVVRIFKSFGSRANKTWNNSYELDIEGEHINGDMGDPAEWTTPAPAIITAAINKLVLFEKQIHLPAIQFIYATGSTYRADSDPYDPSALVTVPLLGTGVRVSTTPEEPEEGAIDLRNVAVCSRTPQYGKLGKIEYRGCLTEEDVFNSGGKWELTAASDFDVQVGAAKESHLGSLLNEAVEGNARLTMIGGTLVKTVVSTVKAGLTIDVIKRTYVAPFHERDVGDVSFFKVGVRTLDNKSFDRP